MSIKLCINRGKYFKKRIRKLIKQKKNEVLKSVLSDTDCKEFVDSDGLTLLLIATIYNNVEIMKYFINLGCEVDAKDLFGRTSLMIATENRNVNAMIVLIDANADLFMPKFTGEYPLQIYLRGSLNREDIIKSILRNMRNLGDSDEKIVKIFVEAGCNLVDIVSMHDIELTKIFIDCKSVTDIESEKKGLVTAMFSQDPENIRILLSYGNRANERKLEYFRSLSKAMTSDTFYQDDHGIIEICAKLIPNWKLLDQNTLIIIQDIVENACVDRLKILFQPQLLSYLESEFGCNLLLHCFGNANPEVIAWIQAQPIDIRSTSANKQSALHIAVSNHVPENVLFLLQKQVDPNIRDQEGATPIFRIFDKIKNIEGNGECVKLLLKYDADLEVCNYNEQSFIECLDLSEDNLTKCRDRYPEIIECFSFLTVVNGSIEEQIKKYMETSPVRELYEMYIQEFETMKTLKILGNLTLFQTITRGILNLSYDVDVLNENMCMTLFKEDIKQTLSRYPKYISLIRDLIGNAIMLHTLRNEALVFIQDNIPCIRFCYPVLYKILSYWNDSLFFLADNLFVNDEKLENFMENITRCELYFKQ